MTEVYGTFKLVCDSEGFWVYQQGIVSISKKHRVGAEYETLPLFCQILLFRTVKTAALLKVVEKALFEISGKDKLLNRMADGFLLGIAKECFATFVPFENRSGKVTA
ncbi:hypothetical protein D1872_288690 [compost metagenome]